MPKVRCVIDRGATVIPLDQTSIRRDELILFNDRRVSRPM